MKKPTINLKNLRKSRKTSNKFERITNETVAEHREKILAGGRRFKYPIQYSRRKLVINAIIVAIAALIVLVAIAWQQLYVAQNSSNLFYRLTQIFPVPVAMIDGESVKYSDYLMQYRGSEYYLNKNDEVNLDTDDGKAQLNYIKRQSLDQAITDAYAAKIARTKGITVSEKDIDAVIEQQRNTANGRITQETYDASSRMMYDWSPAEYRQALRRSILQSKVAFAVDTTAHQQQEKASELISQGENDFTKIAAQLGGSDSKKIQVGDTGMINQTSTFNGLSVSSEVARLEVGKVSGVLKSANDSGYYFVKVTEKTDTKVRFSYLYIPLTELQSQISDLKKEGKVKEFIVIQS